MELSLALQLISERATPLQLDDLVIEGLEDFKTIGQFDEIESTIAFVSHPAWETHLRINDRRFRFYIENIEKERMINLKIALVVFVPALSDLLLPELPRIF